MPLDGEDLEERAQLLFDESPLPMCVFDAETLAFQAVNAAALEHYGYTEAEVLSRTVLDILPPEDVARSREAILVAAPRQWAVSARHVKRDGTIIDVEVVSNAVRWAGRPARLALVRDVTKRQSAERRLAESEARFRAVFEQASVGMVLADDEGRAIATNRRLQEMMGYAEGELAGRRFDDVALGEDARRELQLIERLRRGEFPSCFLQKRFVRKDGKVLWVNLHVSALREGPASELRFLAVIEDVTERKLASEELRRGEEQYRGVLEGIPALVADVGPDGRYRFVNRALGAMLQASPQELVGKTVREAIGEGRFREVEASYFAALAGTQQRLEIFPVTSEGPRRFAVSLVPKTGLGGVPDGYFLIGTDETERDRVEGRAREAEKMEAVGRLAGGVAHDFNNLLTVITSGAHLLLADAGLSEVQREDAREIARAAERAATLTRQLLAFSRRQTLSRRVLDLDTVVSEAEGMLRRLVRENVKLDLSRGRPAGKVLADPGQLEQVLVNLTLNARDALPSGGSIFIRTSDVMVDATLASELGLAAGPHVQLEVGDDGTGMVPEVVEHAFEPFFTTKGPDRGTGLGLSTVHGIVRQSGGQVRITSTPGRGTTVTVYLPTTAEREPGEDPVPQAGAADAAGETILLVEDEPDVRHVARRALESRGYRVLCAPNGRAALELARRSPPFSMLLTDVVMPEMGGPELAAQLEAERPGLPVLFMSGYASDAFRDAGEAGRALLQKPFTPDELARAVRQALDLRTKSHPD